METNRETTNREDLALPTVGQRLCIATKKDGTPCRAPARVGPYCVGHAPGANEARRKGGFNSSKQARLNAMLPIRLKPVFELLETALQEVYSGELEPRKAQAIASLAGASVKVLEVALLEQRIIALEERLNYE